jgi:hypothetical protein
MTLKKKLLGSNTTKKEKLKAFKAKKALERKQNLSTEVNVDKENASVSSNLHKNQKKRALKKKKKAEAAYKRAPLSPKKVSLIDNEMNIAIIEPEEKVEKSLDDKNSVQDVLDFMLEEKEVDVRTHRRLSSSNLSVKDIQRRLSTQQQPPSLDVLHSVDLTDDDSEENKDMEALQKIEDYQAILDTEDVEDVEDENDFFAGYDDVEDTTGMTITYPFSNQMQSALLSESMTASIIDFVVREDVRSVNDIDGVSTIEQDGVTEFMSRKRAASRAPRDRQSSLSSLISGKKGHVEYKIKMTLGSDDTEMILWRRYSDFVTFYTSLKTAISSMDSSRSFLSSVFEDIAVVPVLPSKQTMTLAMNR